MQAATSVVSDASREGWPRVEAVVGRLLVSRIAGYARTATVNRYVFSITAVPSVARL